MLLSLPAVESRALCSAGELQGSRLQLSGTQAGLNFAHSSSPNQCRRAIFVRPLGRIPEFRNRNQYQRSTWRPALAVVLCPLIR